MSDTRPRSTDDATRRNKSTPLLPDDWRELVPLLDVVLDTPLADRDGVLNKLTDPNSAQRAALQKLIEECDRDVPLLNYPAAAAFAALLESDWEMLLPETLGGRYLMGAELGRGGMARVYLAHDIKHSRSVAVKVIRPDLAASLGRERFLREISIAARLRHPNIVPLYDSGDTDGILFFVMPHEEGQSLRERLANPQRPNVAECIGVLRDIARALSYAHERGVVHRDIKPDNVMLSGGAAVVADFGIATAVSVAQGSASGQTTDDSAGIGTPAYMAPEQAIGDPTADHRVDIYSFGCLAYELFSGHPPFDAITAQETVAAQIGTKPRPLKEASSGVPSAIALLIDQCLEKLPASRPQAAADLLMRLEADIPQQRDQNVINGAHRKPAMSRIWLAGTLTLLLAVTAYVVTRDRKSAGTRSTEAALAVLPLESVGGDSLQRELSSGLSEEIANALFRVPGVRIMSRRGVANYRSERDTDYTRTASELGARYLVLGSLREIAGRWRVLARLVDASDGRVTWSGQFDRDKKDLGLLRDEIADSISTTLFGVSPRPVPHTANSAALTLYVLAQQALDRRGLSLKESVRMFREATKIDSQYAPAYSGLSLALALTPFFEATRTNDVAAEAMSSARRALELDSTLSRPYVARGLVHQFAYRWAPAEDEFRRAIIRDRHDVEARVQYGRYLLFQNRVREALAEFIVAKGEEPRSALVLSWVSYAYFLNRQRDSALVESARAFGVDSIDANLTTLALGALVHLDGCRNQGTGAPRCDAAHADTARAMALLLPAHNAVALYVLSAIGDTASINKRRKELPPGPTPWSGTAQAYALLGIGDTTRAMDALESATDANELWPSLQPVSDPLFNSIRGSKRFEGLLQRVGLR